MHHAGVRHPSAEGAGSGCSCVDGGVWCCSHPARPACLTVPLGAAFFVVPRRLCVCRSRLPPKAQHRARQPQWLRSCVTPTAAQARCWRKSLGGTRLLLVHPTRAAALRWRGCCSTVGPDRMRVPYPGTGAKLVLWQRPKQQQERARCKAGTAAGAGYTPEQASQA